LIRGVASAASSRYYVCDMASGVPSTVIAQLRAEITGRLNNPADDVDDATLRQWVAELTEALAHMPVDARRGVVFGLLGTCFYRLHDVAASLDAHRKAALYTPDEADHANNIGTCHLMLGEFAEALDQFRRARALVGSHTNLGPIIEGNIAITLNRLGDKAGAREAFESAVRQVGSGTASQNLRLAFNAASIGYDHTAVEYLARYLLISENSVRGDLQDEEVICSRPNETAAAVGHLPLLADAVHRVLAQWEGPEDDRIDAEAGLAALVEFRASGEKAIPFDDVLAEHGLTRADLSR